jgi:hypothetical protein
LASSPVWRRKPERLATLAASNRERVNSGLKR